MNGRTRRFRGNAVDVATGAIVTSRRIGPRHESMHGQRLRRKLSGLDRRVGATGAGHCADEKAAVATSG